MIDNIKALDKQLKDLGLKEEFIELASEEFEVEKSTVRSNYLSRGEISSKRGYRDEFIKYLQNYIRLKLKAGNIIKN